MKTFQYFATKDAPELAHDLLEKANNWFLQLNTNGYLTKLREMWAAYHGAYFADIYDGHSIVFSGEQGELSAIPINHLHNLAEHMHVMITSTRPALQARSTNGDYKSLIQTSLANGLLDYYLREKRLERYLRTAVKIALVLGSGYVKIEWNSSLGEVYDYNEDTKTEIREGDVVFSNLSPFDVVFDGSKENQDHDWVIARTFKCRFDFVAKYPEYAERIVKLPTKSELQGKFYNSFKYDDTDDIPVYEFFHKKTEAVPDGRYVLFLGDDLILLDMPMPYRQIPIYRIAPDEIIGTPYGYTTLFDILPIQQAINSSYSTILTNQVTFGIQNLWVPDGCDIEISALPGGLNLMKGNASFGKPEAINFTQTPPEVFQFLQTLEKVAETISGVNSVARGNPEASLKSGNALALVQSMALQFMSGLQQSYVQLIEDIGTGLINILRDYAKVPRIAMIVGKDNKSYMREFVGDDLNTINRVIVDIGNPLSKTTAGKVQMAEQMLQMGLIKTPEQYFTVMATGRLDSMTEDTQRELYLVKGENESIIDKKRVMAIFSDQHSLHIREHRTILSDPDLRLDPDLLERVLKHIQEHITLLQTTDPNILQICQEQPLAPPGGSPSNQPNQQPPQASMGQNPEILQPPPNAPQIGTPNMPTLPQVNPGLLPNPELQAPMGNIKQG